MIVPLAALAFAVFGGPVGFYVGYVFAARCERCNPRPSRDRMDT